MKTFKFLRILFLAIISLSIISCTNNGEDDDLGSKSPIPDKGYKKLVQMNIKDTGGEDRIYYNYDKDGILTSLEYCYYRSNGSLGSRDILNFKYENNYILISKNGEEYEKGYEIIDGKITKFIYPKMNSFFTYDNNGRLATLSEEGYGSKMKTVFAWEDGKLVNTTSYFSYYTDPFTNSHSESDTTTRKYTYSSHGPNRCNGFFPADEYLLYYSAASDLCTAPWLIGMEQQDLPEKIEIESISSSSKDDYTNTSITRITKLFTYTYYEDGYLKTLTTERYQQSYASDGCVIEFFWQ